MHDIMARVIKPPTLLDSARGVPAVFLAGSIEMGHAEDWQSRVEESLRLDDVVVLNPRRDEWDSSWRQTISNPRFREQVEWELAGQEMATVITMYFSPATKSPVTLLELGLFARSEKIIVCCPDGFWRKGNVEIVCHRYCVPMVESLDELISRVRSRLLTRRRAPPRGCAPRRSP